MKKFEFKSKAHTLEQLKEHVTKSIILELFYFSVSEWESNPQKVIQLIANQFSADKPLILRSSALGEDTEEASQAGKYTSILNVFINKNLKKSINEVIRSYKNSASSNDNYVLVQPMITDTLKAGVILTSCLETLAPYYTINYSNTLGDTTSVTDGRESQGIIHYKRQQLSKDHEFYDLLCAVKEIEELCNNDKLDIEFGITRNNDVIIFQVRPIVTSQKTFSSNHLDSALKRLYEKLTHKFTSHPDLLGDQPVYGVMPDWNPAEIIGLTPRPLALSLYQELITNRIWAYQRDNYGYRNLRSHPLLHSFLGVPYIDVRVSFNSFIPKDLHKKIAEKLVNYYLNQLRNIPSLHDKVEFQIVHSCYYLNLPEKLKKLQEFGFSNNEITRIEFSLLKLTNNILKLNDSPYRKDIKKIDDLNTRYKALNESEASIEDKIYWHLEDCKRYGTLPFAGIARAAFIAVQFLKSFVELKILTDNEYNDFLNSLNTVNRKLGDDLKKVLNKKISLNQFLKLYGHLRPGTYDILSPRYDENFNNYFNEIPVNEPHSTNFEFTENQLKLIDIHLIDNGIQINATELIEFIKQAIESREYAKFIFTRSLSMVIKLIGELGELHGLTKEDTSFLPISTFINLHHNHSSKDFANEWLNKINENKKEYNVTKLIKLPDLITDVKQLFTFKITENTPNFITNRKVTAKVVRETEIKESNLKGKIVLISSADPGYDFLFTKGISGLITEYGGANSHMAIRCAELGIPAVIGSGKQNFEKWSKANILSIDNSTRTVLRV